MSSLDRGPEGGRGVVGTGASGGYLSVLLLLGAHPVPYPVGVLRRRVLPQRLQLVTVRFATEGELDVRSSFRARV